MNLLRALTLLIGITCMISSVISEARITEDDKVSPSNAFQNRTLFGENKQTVSLIRSRRYRRPHIERVWIMRSFGSESNASAPRSNLTDPIRSFAIAIRDPETFLRYLRQEEKRLLANSSLTSQRQHTASDVGGSLLLNMLSQELVGNMAGSSSSFGDQNKAEKPFTNETAVTKDEHQKTLEQPATYRRSDEQRDVAYLKQRDEQYPYVEHKQHRRPRKQKPERRQPDPQNVKTDDSVIVLSEFGQRLPNYTRPSPMRDFLKSRTLEVVDTPSVYLLPPLVNSFRHFNLQQPMLTITANAMKSSLRRRKRPKTSTTVPPLDSNVAVPGFSQESTINVQLNADSYPDRDQFTDGVDISPKVFAPRPFSSIPFSVLNPTSTIITSETAQRKSNHQQLSSVSPLRVTAPVQSNPTVSSLTDERSTYGPIVDISPPSIHLSPPILDVYNSTSFSQSFTQPQRNLLRSPQYTSQAESRTTSFQSSRDKENVDNNLISPSKAVDDLNEQHQNEPLRNDKGKQQPSYMAIIVDVDFMNKTKRRRPSHRRRPQYNNLTERDYGELQLSAAETAYFKRRQPVMHPNSVFEHMEEIGSIPGKPGMDYPIFSRPPKTSFSCANMQGRRGYFADVNTGCQVFYICSEEGRGEAMLCPNGTLFNQDFLVCDWWFNVACEGAS